MWLSSTGWKEQMTKMCVICELRRYSLLENTSLFWDFVEVNLCQNECSNKNVSNLKSQKPRHSNSKTSLIILKGNLSYIWRKCMIMFGKYFIVTKEEWKKVKILRQHNHLEAITLIRIGGRCPGPICPGVQLLLEEIVQVQSSGDNFPWWEFLGGNCLGEKG